MNRFAFACLLLLSSLSCLRAQCELECPVDQEVVFAQNQFDSLYLPPANLNGCTESLVYTLRGPTFDAGEKDIDEVRLVIGSYTLEYSNTPARAGNFPPEPIYLPDGDGVVYEAPITIDLPDDPVNVAAAGGITEICLLMEHSYLGDLDILIRCPSGTTRSLHAFDLTDEVSGQTLGQGLSATSTPDPFGLYCWSVDAPNTMAEHIEEFNVGDQQPMPSIYYKPESNLSVFNSCPAEGEWVVLVQDNIVRDQGYIGAVIIEFGEDNLAKCNFGIEATFETSVTTPDLNVSNLKGFPNPTTDAFTLKLESRVVTDASISVFSANGARNYQQSAALVPGSNSLQIPSTNWPTGIYNVRIATATGERWTRIVKL